MKQINTNFQFGFRNKENNRNKLYGYKSKYLIKHVHINFKGTNSQKISYEYKSHSI